MKLTDHIDKCLAMKTNIKNSLTNIIHAAKFCGLCLETSERLSSVEEQFDLHVHQQTLRISLYEIICTVFKDVENIVCSYYVCSKCLDSLLQSYKFIENTRNMTKVMQTYLNDFYNKVNDVGDLLKTSDELDSSNVVIVLGADDSSKTNLGKGLGTDVIEDGSVESGPGDKKQVYICRECDIILPNLKKLDLHQLKYHKKELQCKFCPKSFMSVNNLNLHYKTHSAVLCKVCHDVVFHAKIVRHLKENHKESVCFCNICNTVCYSVTALEAHMKISHKDVGYDRCVLCSEKVGTKTGHSCKLKCPECNDIPCKHYKYLMAYREQMVKQESKIKCLDCDYTCSREKTLIIHVNKEHLTRHSYSCHDCSQQFYSKDVLKTHIQLLHMDNYRCEFCDSIFSRKRKYEEHREKCKRLFKELPGDEHALDTSKELAEDNTLALDKEDFITRMHSKPMDILNVKCGICDAAFDSKRTMQLHLRRHGPSMVYRCKICNADFDSLRKVSGHIYSHSSPKATCKICGKVTKEVYLKRHLETHLQKIYSCQACGMDVKGITQYKYHLKQHNMSRVPCPDCGILLHPTSLRKHRLRHRDATDSVINKQRTLKCEDCEYTTTNKTLIECHMNKHRKAKPYICHICSKDFPGRHLLQRHLTTHDATKSVTCKFCGKAFSNWPCLNIHLRLHTGKKPYHCNVCGKSFRSSKILKFHKDTKHLDKNFACPVCSDTFHTIKEMRSHAVKVHWETKDERFDPQLLEGLDEKDYLLFDDGQGSIIVNDDLELCKPL